MITSSGGPGLLFPKVFIIVLRIVCFSSFLTKFQITLYLVGYREGGRMMRRSRRLQLEKLSKKLEFAGFYW